MPLDNQPIDTALPAPLSASGPIEIAPLWLALARPMAIALSAFALATLPASVVEIAMPLELDVLLKVPFASTCATFPVTANEAKIPATTIFFLPVVFLAISDTTT